MGGQTPSTMSEEAVDVLRGHGHGMKHDAPGAASRPSKADHPGRQGGEQQQEATMRVSEYAQTTALTLMESE